MTKLRELRDSGQSIRYDFIRRDMLTGAGLRDLVSSGIRGVTSNPSIFEKAIAESNLYDDHIAELGGRLPGEVFEAFAVSDIRSAADLLLTVYETSAGGDGYVSFEVSPELAHDTLATIADAMRLWAVIDRPNLMIKVPATEAGIPAIEELTATGININATLMFSLSDYESVAMAYFHGMTSAAASIRESKLADAGGRRHKQVEFDQWLHHNPIIVCGT